MRFVSSTYLAVEVLSDLLKRSVAGFDVEEVHNDELDQDPDVVHDVVLPSDVLEGDGVDVLVAIRNVRSISTRRWFCETYKNRAMSTIRNMRVMPLARML